MLKLERTTKSAICMDCGASQNVSDFLLDTYKIIHNNTQEYIFISYCNNCGNFFIGDIY